MRRYVVSTGYQFDRIQYYHRHAGANGYKQAAYHYDELCQLIDRASRSKNDKNDAVVIVALKQSAVELMEEMQKRGEYDNY